MTDITIDGEVFRVEIEGDPARPVLLLSSSLGADLSMWDAQMPAFLREFRVVRYDPRGHGRSTTAGAPYSLARLGADVVAILDALEIERTHYLGISMGGAVGQWLLVNAPERIDRAVLANTNARFAPPQAWNDRIRTARSQGPHALATATMARWFSEGFRASDADKVAAMDKVFRATSGEGYAAAAAALRDMDLREALREIDRPVLLVTGRDDGIASAADIAAMLGAVPGVRHVQLDCQHISNIEARAAFDAAVIGFLTAPLRTAKPNRRTPPGRSEAKPTAKPATRRRPGAAARSPLKRTPAAATPARRRPAATATRSSAKPAPASPAPAKASPRKAARPAASRRVSPVAARAPVAKAAAKKAASAKDVTAKEVTAKPTAAKSPARKAKPSVKVTAKPKPRRKATASVATRKAVAKKAVTKKAVTKKTPVKKAVAKKGAKTATRKVASKPTARRPTKKRPGRPAGRGRR